MHLRLFNTSTYGVLFQAVVVLVCLFFYVFFVGLRLVQASKVCSPPHTGIASTERQRTKGSAHVTNSACFGFRPRVNSNVQTGAED